METLQHVYINFSKREVKIESSEGDVKTVTWKWDREGSEGFAETVSRIQDQVDHNLITYSFATQ